MIHDPLLDEREIPSGCLGILVAALASAVLAALVLLVLRSIG